MPESNFPSSLDTDANSSLPKTISDTAALNNPNHAEMHGRSNDAIIEMQTKIGTGNSGTPTGTTQTAATGAVLIGTGSGASAWDTTPTFVGDVTIPEGDLILGSTAVTSTAAELNILDGCTATVSELNIMDGVTATTSELNILDGVTATASELNILDGVTATTAEINYLDDDDLTAADLTKLAAITSSAAEINVLDDVTGGTVAASKAVVVDGNKDIASFRNVTLTGELDAATLDLSSSADIAGSLTVGADGSGTDVIFYSETAGDHLKWDASEECLIITGTAGQVALDIAAGTVEFNGNVNVGEDGSGHDVRFYSSTAGDSFLWDASEEKLVITGTDGQDALHVADGNVHIDDTLDIDGTIQAASGSVSAPTYTFSGDTNLGIFRHSANSLGISFGGAGNLPPVIVGFQTLRWKTGTGSDAGVIGYDGSSLRYKENVVDFVKSDWEKIYNLQGVRFNWREEVDETKSPDLGFIAEQVNEQIPDLVFHRVIEGHGDDPIPDSVNYEKLCVFLLEAIKDLNNRLETIEG